MEKMKIDHNKLKDLLCVGEDVIHDCGKCDKWVKERFRPICINGTIKCVTNLTLLKWPKYSSSLDFKPEVYRDYIFDCPKIRSNGLLYTVSLLARCKVDDGNRRT